MTVSVINYVTALKNRDNKKHTLFITDTRKRFFFPLLKMSKKIVNKESQKQQVVKSRPIPTELPNIEHMNHHHSQKQVFPAPTLCIAVVRQARKAYRAAPFGTAHCYLDVAGMVQQCCLSCLKNSRTESCAVCESP